MNPSGLRENGVAAVWSIWRMCMYLACLHHTLEEGPTKSPLLKKTGSYLSVHEILINHELLVRVNINSILAVIYVNKQVSESD